MADEVWVLLVHDEKESVGRVERMLLDQGVRTRRVRNFSEARAALREPVQPSLVLTGTAFPDGTWFDVLEAARAGVAEVPVIVVSALVDISLYLDVLETGAHDFIVPPLTSVEFAHVIRAAILKGRPANGAEGRHG
jgi:DNA-binding response OmpR family regulator